MNEKYVKQTYDTMSDFNSNLENIAIQISQLPIREQNRFFRLLLNYIDITAQKQFLMHPPVGQMEVIALCSKLIDTANEHYEELDQLAFEGM